MCRSNVCDEVEPSKTITIRLGDLEDQVEFLNDELDDEALARYASEDEAVAALLRARKERDRMAATFRDNFSRMETLVTTKEEQIDTLQLELDELRKGRRTEQFIASRQKQAICRLQEQLVELAYLNRCCEGDDSRPQKKVIWGGVLASKEAEMETTASIANLLLAPRNLAAREIQTWWRRHHQREIICHLRAWKDYKQRTARSDVMIDAARQRRILDLIMPGHCYPQQQEDDDSDMDTAEDDWESASEAESDAARISERLARPAAWDSAWEPESDAARISERLARVAAWDSAWEGESDEETIWINGEWHYIDTPTAQDWLVSRVI